MKRKILLISLFIFGGVICLFPIYSNWYNNRVHYTLIEAYHEYIDGIPIEEMNQRLEAAHHFNQALIEGTAVYADPFSKEKIKNLNLVEYPEGFEFENVIGSIQIPKINVDLPILFGISEDILLQGVGYMPNTSLPTGGDGVHTVLTGHRGMASSELFRHLNLLIEGDHFFIKSLGQILSYEIDQIKIVDPANVDDLRLEKDKDYVTLVTCHPYMINSQRLLIRGHRINEIQADMNVENTTNFFYQRYKEYIYTIVVVIAFTAVVTFKKYKKGSFNHE